MKGHHLWMLLGCTLPLLLVFLLPLFGISGNVGTFVFILLMFACHLMVTRGHGVAHRHREERPEDRHGSH